MFINTLTILIFASAVLNMRAEYGSRRIFVYISKPLTTSLIIVLPIYKPLSVDEYYRMMIVLGLCFSLAGDIFLMLPKDRFIHGLISFFIAHLFYIAAFSHHISALSSVILLIVFTAYAIIFLRILMPHLGKLKIPVIVYAVVIAAMGLLAAERWFQIGSVSSLFAALGAIFFIASDSALAYNRFVGKFKSAQAMVLSTYFLALWLIAMSV